MDTLTVVLPVSASTPARDAYASAAWQARRVARMAGLRVLSDPQLTTVDDGHGPAVLASVRTCPTSDLTEGPWVRLADSDPYHQQRVDAVRRLTEQGMSVSEIASTAGLPVDEVAALHLESLDTSRVAG